MSVADVPEERWARDFVAGRDQLAQVGHECTVAEAVQAAVGNAEAVHEDLIRTALGQILGVPDDEWAQLRVLERRMDDGFVLWRPFLRWTASLQAERPWQELLLMIMLALQLYCGGKILSTCRS